jgi:hypothetical protein
MPNDSFKLPASEILIRLMKVFFLFHPLRKASYELLKLYSSNLSFLNFTALNNIKPSNPSNTFYLPDFTHASPRIKNEGCPAPLSTLPPKPSYPLLPPPYMPYHNKTQILLNSSYLFKAIKPNPFYKTPPIISAAPNCCDPLQIPENPLYPYHWGLNLNAPNKTPPFCSTLPLLNKLYPKYLLFAPKHFIDTLHL